MNDEILIETTAEVWRAIYDQHREALCVHGSYSAPCGGLGDSFQHGVMQTRWGFRDAAHPIIETDHRWDNVWTEGSTEIPQRVNERWRYWLVCKKDC